MLKLLALKDAYLTNEDGRKIALYDNGTWEYIDVNHPGE